MGGRGLHYEGQWGVVCMLENKVRRRSRVAAGPGVHH